MDAIWESAALLFQGVLFTFLGGLKLYGLFRGYEGGPGKSLWERLRAGTCPEGHCRLPSRIRKPFYLMFALFFLVTGLFCLAAFCFTAFA